MTSAAGAPLNLAENTDIGFGIAQGKVIMQWPQPRTHLVFKAEAAFAFGEEIARVAYRCAYPDQKLPSDFSYLAQQLKQRLTDDMRNRLLNRVATMLPSLIAKGDLSYAAAQLVDTLFSALDTESYTKLEVQGFKGVPR